MARAVILLGLALLAGAFAFLPTGLAAVAAGLGAVIVLGGAIALRRRQRAGIEWVVVDGSNVMYWLGEPPQVQVVKDVLDRVRARGLRPVVWFDANAGYRLSGSYMGPEALAAVLKLPADHVFVAPRGTPADPLLLDGAQTLAARIVSNDRYRDWAGQYPLVDSPGRLIRGRVVGGLVALDFGPVARPAATPVRR